MVFGRTGLSGSKMVKCRVAEYFPEKSGWCLVEQVCLEVSSRYSWIIHYITTTLKYLSR